MRDKTKSRQRVRFGYWIPDVDDYPPLKKSSPGDTVQHPFVRRLVRERFKLDHLNTVDASRNPQKGLECFACLRGDDGPTSLKSYNSSSKARSKRTPVSPYGSQA
jgi:hypothetical protein